MIAEEMIRIDIDLPDDAGETEPDDAPVVTGRPPPPGLPAVHPLAAVGVFVRNKHSPPGLDEVFFRSKELIIRQEDAAARTPRRKIDKPGRRTVVDLRGLVHDLNITEPIGSPPNAFFL